MMMDIKNYIKDGEDFIPIEEFTGTIPDPEYIDSAMELTVESKPIITCAEWDYMDPLWAYIANGFEDLANTGINEWKTYFPDQPIKLTFRLHRKKNLIDIEMYIPKSDLLNLQQETRKVTTNLTDFLTAMSRAGQNFFRRMAEIVPQYKNEYEYEAERMKEMATKLLQSIDN